MRAVTRKKRAGASATEGQEATATATIAATPARAPKKGNGQLRNSPGNGTTPPGIQPSDDAPGAADEAASLAAADKAAKSKDFVAAARHYARALKINPNTPRTHLLYGQAKRELGDLDEATKAFRAAYSLLTKPTVLRKSKDAREGRADSSRTEIVTVLRHLGAAEHAKGLHADAARRFAQITKLMPNDSDAIRALLAVGRDADMVIGHAHMVAGPRLIGWLVYPANATVQVTAELFLNNRRVLSFKPSVLRSELAGLNIQAGLHGFDIHLHQVVNLDTIGDEFVLDVRVPNRNSIVVGAPLQLSKAMIELTECFNANNHHHNPDVVALGSPGGIGSTLPIPKFPLNDQAFDPEEPDPTTRTSASHLFEIEPQYRDRPFPITRVLAHMQRKYVENHPFYRQYVPFHLNNEENALRFMEWFLNFFAFERRGYPVPLGKALTDYLNAPIFSSDVGIGKISRLMHLEWLQVRGSIDIFNEHGYHDFLAHWADKFRNTILLDRLIPKYAQEVMNASAREFTHQAVPLSNYMVARWRRSAQWRSHYKLDTKLSRLGFALDFALDEIAYGYGLRFIPAFIRAILTAPVASGTKLTFWQLYVQQGCALSEADAKQPYNVPTRGDLTRWEEAVDALPADHPIHLDGGSLVSNRNWRTSAGEDLELHTGERLPGVTVVGALASQSGLGHNAVMSVGALRDAKIPFSTLPFAINDASVDQNTARIVPADTNKYKVNLIHLQPDNLPESVFFLDPRIWRGAYNIGFYAWEMEQQPKAHLLGIGMVDEIWVPSEFVRRGFQNYTDRPVINVGHAIDLSGVKKMVTRRELGLSETDFLFYFSLDIHSWTSRKNPLAVVRAFQLAFPNTKGVGLVLKARNGHRWGQVDSDLEGLWQGVLDLASRDPRIQVVTRNTTFSETISYTNACDCYVSLHRSEGFGYTMAEAMLLGKPVIATGYSGNLEYMNEKNSFLVAYEEVYVGKRDYIFFTPGLRWAEPDIDDAARQMRVVVEDEKLRQKKAKLGQETIRDEFALSNLADRYRRRLEAIL